MEKLDVKSFTLGVGAVGVLYMLFHGLGVMLFGWGTALSKVIGSLYIGFEPSILGVLIGAVWGFIDGAIAGLIIALVYNKLISKK